MKCHACGHDIAANAIVCYKCGAPTAIPERPAPKAPQRLSPASVLLITTLVMLAGLIAWYLLR